MPPISNKTKQSTKYLSYVPHIVNLLTTLIHHVIEQKNVIQHAFILQNNFPKGQNQHSLTNNFPLNKSPSRLK